MCFYRFILNGQTITQKYTDKHSAIFRYRIHCLIFVFKIEDSTQNTIRSVLSGQFTRRDNIDIKIRKKQSRILSLIFPFCRSHFSFACNNIMEFDSN